MSWLSQLFHPGKGYDNAKETSQKYYNDAQSGLNPYNQNGQAAQQQLMDFLKNLSDPSKLQEEWGKNYKESDYAKQLGQSSIDKGLNAAGSMGLIGSSAALNNIQEEGSDIMAKDRQQYMDDLMKKYMAGIGLGENISGMGAAAAGQQSQNAMNQGTTEANLDFGKYNAGPNMITGGIGALMKFLESMNNSGSNYGKGMYNGGGN